MTASVEITQLLERWKSGDETALKRLLPVVYEQLRTLARRQFQRERDDHTLQPTALVHEAYVKLLGQDPGRVENRTHFYALAAKAMRQVLVDHARRKNAERRAGDRQRITLTDAVGQALEINETAVDVVTVHEALERLAQIRPRAAQVVELRYFGGMTLDETAEALGTTQRTVLRDWNVARLWLLDRL